MSISLYPFPAFFCHGKHLKAGLELLRKNPLKPVSLLVSPYSKKAVSPLFQWMFLIPLSSADQLSNGIISNFNCCRERKKKIFSIFKNFLKVAFLEHAIVYKHISIYSPALERSDLQNYLILLHQKLHHQDICVCAGECTRTLFCNVLMFKELNQPDRVFMKLNHHFIPE